jgi:pyocin large subunit-like protein
LASGEGEAEVGAKAAGIIAKLAEEQFGKDAAEVSAGDLTEVLARTVSQDATRSEEPAVVERAGLQGSSLLQYRPEETWANPATLDDHFERHGGDFGATSATDYANMASQFFQRGIKEGLPIKISSDGTIRIYDPATNTFGSYRPDGTTKTFFKPTNPNYWQGQPGTLQ